MFVWYVVIVWYLVCCGYDDDGWLFDMYGVCDGIVYFVCLDGYVFGCWYDVWVDDVSVVFDCVFYLYVLIEIDF